MTESKVLILSSKEDGHAQFVGTLLEEMKVAVDFLKFDEFAQHCKVGFSLENASDRCVFQRPDGDLDLRSYTSIWHRRPGRVRPGSFFEPWIGGMVEHESRAALEGILRTLPCLWVNVPANDTACSSKLWQLALAREIGLLIPKTLVTNKPEEARQFFERCHGQVIYKLLSEGARFSIPLAETPNGLPTLMVREEDLPFLDQVAHAPHFFQQYIGKKVELRVTIVGKELYCNTIDSQAGTSKVDWRNDYSVDMQKFDLPEQIQSKCFQLMKRLGLNYGAMDFIVNEKDEFVFLEINSVGQYLWAELRAGLPISQQLANLLAGKVEPLVHATY